MQGGVQVLSEGELFGPFVDAGSGSMDGPLLVPDIEWKILLGVAVHDTS